MALLRDLLPGYQVLFGAAVDEWTAAALAGDGTDSQAPTQVAEAVDALLGVSFD